MQTIETGSIELLNGSITVVGGTISGTFVGDGGSIIGTVLSSSYATTSSFVSGAYTSQWSLTGSYATTASYALNSAGSVTSAQTASVAVLVSGSGTGSFTGSFTGSATTASFVSGAYTSQWALTSSFATTASFALNSAGSVTSAQTASVAFTLSGSATGTLTGSITGTLLGTGSWASSASVAISASFVSASYVADWAQTAQTSSFVSGAYTAQWALSSSWAPGAFDATVVRGYSGSFTGSVTGALKGSSSFAQTASYGVTTKDIGGGDLSYQTNWMPTWGNINAKPYILNTAPMWWAPSPIRWDLSGTIYAHADISAAGDFYAPGRLTLNKESRYATTARVAEITGSMEVNGAITASSGFFGTASWASSASFVSGAYTARWALSAQTAVGNAGTATALATARLINGTSFDGTANIATTSSWTTMTSIPIGLVSQSAQINSGTFSGSVTGALQGTSSWAQSASFAISASFVSGAYTAQWAKTADSSSFVSGAYTAKWALSAQSAVGNAGTATALATARLINGVSFDGTANIATTASWTGMTNIPVGLVSGAAQINTGSFSGSFSASTPNNGITGSVTGALLGTSSWAQSSSFVSGAYTAQWAKVTDTASFVSGAYTAQWALSASWAPGAFDATVSRGYTGSFTGSVTGALQGSSSYALSSSYARVAQSVLDGAAFDATVVRGYSGTFSGSADNATSFFGTASYALASPGGGGDWSTLTNKPVGIISGGIQYGYDITGSTYISGVISSSEGFWLDNGDIKYEDNIERLTISGSIVTTGSFRIGKETAFDANNPAGLEISASSKISVNMVNMKGALNNYLQLNIQNTSASVSASSDIVATNDAGTEIGNYINMGINSTTFISNGNGLGGPNDAYLYTTSSTGDLYVGNVGGGANNNVKIFAGAGFDAGTNTHIFVSSSGKVGIGMAGSQTGSIINALQVDGNVSASSYTSSFNNAVGYFGTASWAATSSFVSGAYTAQWALSSSFVSRSYTADWALLGQSAISSTFATTASFANTFTVGKGAVSTDNLTVSGGFDNTGSMYVTGNIWVTGAGITGSYTGAASGVFYGTAGAGTSFVGTASMALTQSLIQSLTSASYASASSTASSLLSVGAPGVQVINKFAFANILLVASSASFLSTDAVGIAGIKKIATGALEVYWNPAFATSNSYAVQVQAYGYTGSTTLAVANMRRAFIPYQSQSATTISIQCVDETSTTHLTKDPWKYSIMAWGY